MGEVRILIVDPDAVTRRLVELTVAPQPGWSVECARDGQSGLEIIRTEQFDVILCERNLPDMTALQFHRRLLQETRLNAVPFVILSIDGRVDSRVAALRAGIDDYVLKPVDAAELQARIESHVGRGRRARALGRGRRYLLAGDFSALAFPDLVSTLSLQRRTGTIAFNMPAAMGEVHLAEGEVVHAVFGNLTGAAAFNAVFRQDGGQFEFTPEATALDVGRRTISGSVTSLILEAARLVDEAAPMPAIATPAAPPSLAIDKSHHPARNLAGAFATAFSDPFSLGELFFWTGPELAAWTRKEFHERLHLHLITDLSAGLCAVLPLAASAGERQLLAALRSGNKLPGLVYFLRGERLLDVTIADIDSPLAEAHSMRRNPAITIIAPTRGDPLESGPRAQLGLKTLLGLRTPELVVGLGNGSMDGFLAQTLDPTVARFSKSGAIGESDLREVFAAALTAWGRLP